MTIGESIRHHRKRLNLTQTQLAQRIGVTARTVSKWENGTALPKITMAAPLARALGTTTDELLRFGERYREFEKLWEKALRTPGDNDPILLEVAEAALREFPWDKTFLFRAAWTARKIAEESGDAVLREEYLGRAGAHAQLLVEMDPENKCHSIQLREQIFGALKEIWKRREDAKRPAL